MSIPSFLTTGEPGKGRSNSLGF